jgi:hypothetical protein
MPFYETEDSVRHVLSKGYKGINNIDLDKVEYEEKTLIITDILKNMLVKHQIKNLYGRPTKRWLNTLMNWAKKEFLF